MLRSWDSYITTFKARERARESQRAEKCKNHRCKKKQLYMHLYMNNYYSSEPYSEVVHLIVGTWFYANPRGQVCEEHEIDVEKSKKISHSNKLVSSIQITWTGLFLTIGTWPFNTTLFCMFVSSQYIRMILILTCGFLHQFRWTLSIFYIEQQLQKCEMWCP